jgi:hypothetical protein
MTAQQKTLSAPLLKEAIEHVLHIDQLTGPAHGQVMVLSGVVTGGDKVEFTVQTSTGNTWSESSQVVSVPSIMEFAIPKDTFAKKLRYSVTNASGNPAHSPDLLVKLEK